MKNSIKLETLMIMTGIILLSSCKKDLVEPEQPLRAYSDTITARDAVNKLYTQGLPKLYLSADKDNGIPLAWGSYLSGLFESEANQGYYIALKKQNLTEQSVQDLSRQIYTECFDGIENADTIISQIPNTKGLSQEEKIKLIGEAKFFRAFNRFYLIRSFGSYPDKRHGTSWLSTEKAYLTVEKDLLDAVATLPQKSLIENKSHVTAFSARALLGDIYLHMSGIPLQKDMYVKAAEILRPIIKSDRHHLAINGTSEERSAINILRTNPYNDEYLFVIHGECSLPRASFAFPEKARKWNNIKEKVVFNAFKPTKTFMHFYTDRDIRGKDRQFFHSFFKVKEDEKTVFEIFDPAPYFWLSAGTELEAQKIQHIGIYPYAEVLLIAAEAIAHSEGVTQEAVNYLMQVRTRSVSEEKNDVYKMLSMMSAEKFIQEIWLERFRELPFEMKQLSDILRTDHYPIYKDSTLLLVPLKEAVSLYGKSLKKQFFYLPKPTS